MDLKLELVLLPLPPRLGRLVRGLQPPDGGTWVLQEVQRGWQSAS